MGALEYLNHDDTREKPVVFEWQIMDWRVPPAAVLNRIGLTLEQGETAVSPSATTEFSNMLIMRPAPPPKPAKGAAASSPMGKKNLAGC